MTSVELEGEVVVYAGDLGTVYKLDALATAVWCCLDGTLTLRQLVGELQAVFEGERDRIAADVLDYARTLDRQGLIEGVGLTGQE